MMLWVGVKPGTSASHLNSATTSEMLPQIRSDNFQREHSAIANPNAKNINHLQKLNSLTSKQVNNEPQHIDQSDQHRAEARNIFLAQQINKIKRNEKGEFEVVIATDTGENPISIQSHSPIYYPSETDLNYGVKGCVLGGYYVELNHQISLTIGSKERPMQYQYRCTFNSETNIYTLEGIQKTE